MTCLSVVGSCATFFSQVLYLYYMNMLGNTGFGLGLRGPNGEKRGQTYPTFFANDRALKQTSMSFY